MTECFPEKSSCCWNEQNYIFVTSTSLENIYCNRVRHWLGNVFLWPFSVRIHWRSHLKKQSRDPDVLRELKMTPVKRVKRCNMSMSKFKIIDAFFVNIPALSPNSRIVESASCVMLVKIHNVDDATSN